MPGTVEIPHYKSLTEVYETYIGEYKSKSYKPFVVSFKWDRSIADFMRNEVSATRCQKRIDSYIIPGEFDRTDGSLRFGVEKKGHGYQGKRGDFCIVGGYYQKPNFTAFYRSVELISGLHFDTVLFDLVEKELGPIKKITVMAVSAFIFARRGNSGEKVFAKLQDYYYGR